MGEAEKVCCASSTSNSAAHPDPDPMHACSGAAPQGPPDCEEKRDPRRDAPADHQPKLDPSARLEKRTSNQLRECDIPCSRREPFVRSRSLAAI